MGRFLKFLAISTIIVFISFGIYEYTDKYDLKLIYENIEWSIGTKGCESAVSFAFDKKNNLYIAYKDSIKTIRNDNKEVLLVKDEEMNIYDILCYKDDTIIIATDNRVIKYNIENNQYKELINNLPNNGLNNETKLLLKNDDLYITIGSNTNSGIVEDENTLPDKASFEWISNGETYGQEKTGAFSEYGQSIKDGEKIKESEISNGSIIKYDLDKDSFKTYATGIRNIEGLSFDSDGKLIAIVGGMNNTGARRVLDDVDYIYEIKENSWYGWPDFSGGDPIKSPRFSEEGYSISYLINNHPTEVIYGPKYQHNSVSSLKGLAIDSEGKCLVKDTIVFSDNKTNDLYILSKEGVARRLVELGNNSKVEKIVYNDSSIYVLDSLEGCLYKIDGLGENTLFKLPINLWIFIAILTFTIVFAMMYKLNSKKGKR